ncbi:hypothetical protein [Deinococcus yavapaiensis]|uniref:Flagellar protein FlhE n=1 Tax=Deinococcus yavapaiensis KR-236 TaxID=694435 RepID=A0A318SDZ7_9DEIO|nr:hypothetical protein [Deinococcus yavapaiensis]PYE54742.1 hypothetical protein DES52_10412 [Deinococcus yavapaiensis KR-236]
MKRLGRSFVMLVLAVSSAAAAPLVPRAVLKPTTGGVLVEAALSNVGEGDVLTGVWTANAKANLLECAPRCRVVASVPLSVGTTLGARTRFRVVLGGRFRLGQKVGLLFSFRGRVAAVEATVTR